MRVDALLRESPSSMSNAGLDQAQADAGLDENYLHKWSSVLLLVDLDCARFKEAPNKNKICIASLLSSLPPLP